MISGLPLLTPQQIVERLRAFAIPRVREVPPWGRVLEELDGLPFPEWLPRPDHCTTLEVLLRDAGGAFDPTTTLDEFARFGKATFPSGFGTTPPGRPSDRMMSPARIVTGFASAGVFHASVRWVEVALHVIGGVNPRIFPSVAFGTSGLAVFEAIALNPLIMFSLMENERWWLEGLQCASSVGPWSDGAELVVEWDHNTGFPSVHIFAHGIYQLWEDPTTQAHLTALQRGVPMPLDFRPPLAAVGCGTFCPRIMQELRRT